jgi:hypothetical protein
MRFIVLFIITFMVACPTQIWNGERICVIGQHDDCRIASNDAEDD